jgi:hypothetical protein
VPHDRRAIRPRRLEREQSLASAFAVLRAKALLLGTVLPVEGQAAVAVEELPGDADDAGGVEHVHGRRRVFGRDPDGGVLA